MKNRFIHSCLHSFCPRASNGARSRIANNYKHIRFLPGIFRFSPFYMSPHNEAEAIKPRNPMEILGPRTVQYQLQ